MKEILRVKEAAQFLQLSVSALNFMRYEKSGPEYFRAGGKPKSPIRYTMASLLKWIQETQTK